MFRNSPRTASTDPKTNHWSRSPERGSIVLMRVTAWAVHHVGRKMMVPIVPLVVLYFFVFGATARRSIRRYQQLLQATTRRSDLFPRRWPVYRQFLTFADALLDKLEVWRGKITCSDIVILDNDALHAQMGKGRGQVLVGAHLGNLEVCRALAEKHTAVKLNVLVHSKHAEKFNQLLGDAGASGLRLYQVTELDAGVMLDLHDRVERGEWIAIAGDRVPLYGMRVAEVNFLGERAQFPQGPWLLAGLLRCPVNLLFCVKLQGRYRVTLERLQQDVVWQRGRREIVIADLAQRYADRLAIECASAPLQWFNFYSFWHIQARSQKQPERKAL